MKLLLFASILLVTNTLLLSQHKNKVYAPKYNVEDGAITGYNINCYNNRPLYINNSNAFILTGDKPFARLVKGQYIYGMFMLAIERNGESKWLQHCNQIKSIYNPGRMTWEVTDKSFPSLKIILDILPVMGTTGMAVCAVAKGIEEGDRLIWAFGGAQCREKQNLSWELDVLRHEELLDWGFVAGECKNNSFQIEKDNFILSLANDKEESNNQFSVAGNCSSQEKIILSDATDWINPSMFANYKANGLPIVNGAIILKNEKKYYWAFEAFDQKDSIDLSVKNPEIAFKAGLKRTDSFKERLKINTPDHYLNAIAQASVAAVDGTWYPPVFVHGAMSWNVRFPGWRTIFGGTMYGWHDRVKDEARFYIDHQIKKSDKKDAIPDPKLLLTAQHKNSRFYGEGRIDIDQAFYNMQTQFFDQLVEEYRWTNDPELVQFFREALELHLKWIRDCFDPDGDGVYESYINTFPTDSQWYNGGGTAEETSYAYRGHLAARDMARNAGDKEAEVFHVQMLAKIEKGFFEKLWIKEKGHSGSYREQGGHERLHKDPWLYSIFLPIDAGLTSPLQAIESVYYSEWALQNDRVPIGGRKVWNSNWVPYTWSVRELWPGDNYHLALSYFQARLPNDGWDIMRGTFMHSAFNDLIPGNLGEPHGGIDFGDCVHTFTRTLVSGLFGYTPDYPNGNVKIAPQFPIEWEYASIELPDVEFDFNQKGNQRNYTFSLHQAANVDLFLPVQSNEIKDVTVNGQSYEWELLPGIGNSLVHLHLTETSKAEIIINTGNKIPYYTPVKLEGNIGDTINIKTGSAHIIEYYDPQSVLENERIEEGTLSANLTSNKGYHTVVVKALVGEMPQLRVFRIRVNDPKGDALQKARFVDKIPLNANWENIDIEPLLNADVTKIYKQEYLYPRPNTVSVRLGTDGYSPWTFPHWNVSPPEIKLNNTEEMMNDRDNMVTPQGVPFNWNTTANNIAFTSVWDNYPVKIDFPVNEKGKAIYFLVCGSTNIMQCQIANAVIRLNYVDGLTDSLELIPPVNYWNLCPITNRYSLFRKAE